MTTATTYPTEIKAALHELALGLHESGLIDQKTMRHFDQSCLTPIKAFSPSEIRALRNREEVSQTVFANYLNVSKESVSQWERGDKHPSGASLKLLSLVHKNGLSAIA